ncbi:MAG TPA: hypothetical protein VIK91_10000 [Nannocystis sp.]
MRILVNAIITGFGLKLGGDIYRFVKKKLGLPDLGDERVPPIESEQQS